MRQITFYELTCPSQDGASGGKDWTTYHKAVGPAGYYYLRNDGSGYLIDLSALADVRDIYFETEQDCHAAAMHYYHHHNKSYPYVKEYNDCLNRLAEGPSTDIVLQSMVTVIQSEEMFF